MRDNLSQSELCSILDYNPETGEFWWRARPGDNLTTRLWNARYARGASGVFHKRHGYRVIQIHKRKYQAHRLAWLYMMGAWPIGVIDHINRVRSDNRWANLRDISICENGWNIGVGRRNSSGYLGVSRWKKSGRWRANIDLGGVRVHLGSFDNLEDAISARVAAEKSRANNASEVRT